MRAICSQRLLHGRRAVDAEHCPFPFLPGEAHDHAGLRRAGHRAGDDRVEEEAELRFLGGHLAGPVGKPMAAERMVGGAGRDRVGLAADRLDGGERLLPALAEADVEAGVREAHVRPHDAGEQDVADQLVAGVVPVDPVLLHEHAVQAQVGGDGRHLAGVVRLHAADRDERVAPLGERVGREVLELAGLVATEGEAGVAVLPLRPDLDLAAQVLREAVEAVHRGGAEEQWHLGEVGQAHEADSAVPAHAPGDFRLSYPVRPAWRMMWPHGDRPARRCGVDGRTEQGGTR